MITKPKIYTEEFVLNEVKTLLQELLCNNEIVYLGELFETKEYTRQRFSEWSEEYSENTEISDTIKRIKEILEARVNIGGLKGKLNPTMSIFNLKNNYNWTDKSELVTDQKIQTKQLIMWADENTNEQNNSSLHEETISEENTQQSETLECDSSAQEIWQDDTSDQRGTEESDTDNKTES